MKRKLRDQYIFDDVRSRHFCFNTSILTCFLKGSLIEVGGIENYFDLTSHVEEIHCEIAS